ncbi:Xylose isomerase domain protein [Methanocaldococcus lauensis]|uniref:Xylose isomerase domain protein n=1 Tax=Methanocaldococcus lauensis TaxID=2546128 RepID=A0A8D6SWA4_9EURY|nr:sugar phosphate isomerase/epimerase [Methanocaldococcus lauensis]CAB3288670.1 Xylose isomerase domain protein [Methanocaldococcus lauensis]
MIGICMRSEKGYTFNNKLVDWGLHYNPKIVKKNNIIGYHAPILNLDEKESVSILKNIIENIKGKDYLTIHLHNGKNKDIDKELLIENLSIVNEFAQKNNVKLCIENLREGFSSNPNNIIEIADEINCFITFDIGHIPYNKRLEFLYICSDRIYNSHVYEIEMNGKHLPPKNLNNLKPILDALLDVKCEMFLIELMDINEILRTEKMIKEYLEAYK